MDHWEILIAIGALAVALFSAFSRIFDKSLSIREHDEFRANINKKFDGVDANLHREIARLENRIERIEGTRPTTGELRAMLGRPKESP